MTEDRDSGGHFIKGNVPWNRTPGSTRREIAFTCQSCGRLTAVEEMPGADEVFSRPRLFARSAGNCCSKRIEIGEKGVVDAGASCIWGENICAVCTERGKQYYPKRQNPQALALS